MPQTTEPKSEDKGRPQSPAASEVRHMEPPQRCVACKQEILAGAAVCPVCKSHQRRWKNHLQYFAGIVTLAALTATATTWLVGRVYAAFFAHEDIHIVECNSLESAVIVNRGHAEVFLSHMLLRMTGQRPEWTAQQLEINEKLPPGQFLKREFYPARIKGKSIFVRSLNDDQFQKLIARAAAEDPCVEAAYYGEGDSGLQELLSMAGRPPNTFGVVGYLEYWGYRGTAPMRLPITGTGVLRVDSSRQECMDSVASTTGTRNFF